MKKIFSILAAGVCSIAAMANTYTGTMTVILSNGEDEVKTTIENAQVVINNEGNNTFSISTSDLTVSDGEATVNLGSLVLNGVGGSSNATTSAAFHLGNITFSGAEGTPFDDCMGIVMARCTQDYAALDANISVDDDTDMTILFDNTGDAFQIKNSDFELWTASSGEAVNWHGFKSASGSLAQAASSTFGKSTDVRPGSKGKYSAIATSNSTFGIVANGTMTNGQLNAANMSAANTSNHSHMDKASTEKDKDGNPFYTPLLAQPDSVNVWIKFSQGTANKSYPYCTISAIVYDDTSTPGATYYQDPENKTYANVVARAKKSDIVVSGWNQYSIPFTPDAKTAANKSADAILVTASTNATPGKGSKGDQILLDDLQLVYEAAVTSVSYNGEALTFDEDNSYTMPGTYSSAPSLDAFTYTTKGASALPGVVCVESDEAYMVTVYAVSGDLKKGDLRNIIFPKDMTDTPQSLEDVLDLATDGETVTIDALYIAHGAAGTLYCTDGDDNWISVVADGDVFSSILNSSIVTNVKGVINNLKTNPTITLTDYKDCEGTGHLVEFETIDLVHHFQAKPCGVYKVSGYADANGNLRAYSGNNGTMGQALAINNVYLPGQAFVPGQFYNLVAAFTINEPWYEDNSAPRKISAEYYFQNYTILPLELNTVSTGIDVVDATAKVVSVRYYNMAGAQVDAQAQGSLIMVKTMSDGKVKVEKIIK
ncbi:MAG: hypothetical protein MJZ74_00500 [Muribaculaceae bacterium]|nr:hypothetical protein [Muribaculaceae bacterium]